MKLMLLIRRLLFVSLLVAVSCEPRAIEVDLTDRPITIGPTAVEFTPAPSLIRNRRHAALHIKLEEAVRAEHPFAFVRLSDDRIATVTVSMETESGKTIEANVLGTSGLELNARFDPEFPEDEKISRIRISSDVPVQATRIYWYNFNPD